MWHVEVPEGVSVYCCSCGDAIPAGELRFAWSPPLCHLEPRRGYFHAACAVRAGSLGPHLPVRRPHVREAPGLPRGPRLELCALLDGLQLPQRNQAIVDLTSPFKDTERVEPPRCTTLAILDAASPSVTARGCRGAKAVEKLTYPAAGGERRAMRIGAVRPGPCVAKKPSAAGRVHASGKASIAVPKRVSSARCVVRTQQKRTTVARRDGSTEERRSKVRQEQYIRGRGSIRGKKVERRDKKVVRLKSGKTRVTETITFQRVSWR